MMMPKRLLAKSFRNAGPGTEPPEFALLTAHTRDVADAGEALLGSVGTVALSNAGLPRTLSESFTRSVRLDTWLQDLGKANDQYYSMLTTEPGITQLLRHEMISGVVAMLPEFRGWLQKDFNPEVLFPAIWGAVGHHRKFSDKHWMPKLAQPLRVFLAHDDFKSMLTEMRSRLHLTDPIPELRNLSIGSGRGAPCDLQARHVIDRMLDDFESWAEHGIDETMRRFVALVKAFGIAADVCASAVASSAKVGTSMGSFVADQLRLGLAPGDFDQIMLHWAWENVDHGLELPAQPNTFPPGFTVRLFQRDVEAEASLGSRLVLATAGCGSGKSLAAYLWGKRWCQARRDQGRDGFRFIFTLPTTGTTTEHFKDYSLACGLSPQLKGLSHSRASVDLSFLAQESAPQEEGDRETEGHGRSVGEREAKQATQMLQAQRDKIESLDLWGTPLIVSTTDTVLGLMANSRRSVYSFPALMQSAIVFDEIHAFDDELFGHLLVFLENFPNIPVLLMTASLPEERLAAIRAVRPDLRCVAGPPELELAPCYETPLTHLTENEVWDHVRQSLSDPGRGKVLWVRNQVGWANSTYQRCFEELRDLNPFIGLYHSRYRYVDRVHIHRRAIDEFRRPGSPALLVATQVAEMSLNLSADLLVTDPAPIPPLIQRFGRLNREATPRKSPSGRSIVCDLSKSGAMESAQYLPYERADVEQGTDWLEGLIRLSRRLSQRDLITAFRSFKAGKAVDLDTARQRAVFFAGLWKTYPASTRGEGSTIAVILQEDYRDFPRDRFNDLRFKRDWLREHEVSIPIRRAILGWSTFGYAPIAPSELVGYGRIDATDPATRTGASWRSNLLPTD
jgi:CRISPR-associated endonuclease/helicase Cas3